MARPSTKVTVAPKAIRMPEKASISTASNLDLLKAVRKNRRASVKAFEREMARIDKAIIALKNLDKGIVATPRRK